MQPLPRGIRNHNPGNIERTGTRWQGMALDQSGDRRFIIFTAPSWGIRAIARILITYQDKHGLRTVRGIINRWAPPTENNTDAYINAVSNKLGVGPDQRLDVYDFCVMRELVQAIIRHENGSGLLPNGNWYPEALVDQGLRLAGIVPGAHHGGLKA